MHGEEESSTQNLDVEIPEIDDSAGPAEQRLWKLATAAAERGDKVAWERLNAAFRRLEAMRRQAQAEDRETAAELGRD